MGGRGNLVYVFNAHLPYVKRQLDDSERIEERWLFDSLVWSYIPFIEIVKDTLGEDKDNISIGISLSSTLLSMLKDPFLIADFEQYLEDSIILGEKERKRLINLNTKESKQCVKIATTYRDHFLTIKHLFIDEYHKDIISQWKLLASFSSIEFLTTAATHAFFPNMRNHPSMVRSQIKNGLLHFEKIMGIKPKGFLLPECGYYEGLESILEEFGIEYSFCDTRAVVYADKPSTNAIFYPVRSTGNVIFFPRDTVSSDVVWSTYYGYMSNALYREFSEDIGNDVSLDYLATSTRVPDVRVMTGYKYYSINGDIYDEQQASAQVKEDVTQYISYMEERFKKISQVVMQKPTITKIFDLNLLGHRWYEGLEWFEQTLMRLAHHDEIKVCAPSKCLEGKQASDYEEILLSFSSWSQHGYAQVWVDDSNKTLNRNIYRCIELYKQIIQMSSRKSDIFQRVIRQAGRELLLAQSSDWLFMLYANKFNNFAHGKIQRHIYNFNKLYHMLLSKKIDFLLVYNLERQYDIFTDFDFAMFEKPISVTF